ncbi:MAG: hypothetical protein KDK97_19315 [Verrucomicrobiales bacterium]|nr:hypothetical protein [Verrucomicrobiales bacterium]MCP5558765.1 hypothetical protein [Verrucomicrobiaceae bacterium]
MLLNSIASLRTLVCRLGLVLGLLAVPPTFGCTIPVFRYALDRWDTDMFEMLLPKAVSQQQAVRDLLRPLRANGAANLQVRESDDAALAEPTLLFPHRPDAVWSGALTAESLQSLLESPARREIIRRTLEGDSLTWVVVDGGDAAGGEKVEHLKKRLAFLEQAAALPPQDPDDPDSQLGPGPPLLLKFGLLRLGLTDPAEQAMIKMLAGPSGAGIEPGTSFAAVMFGRGRVLGAWSLEDLTDTVLEDASMFLIGRCSCRVKNENPGWDVLLNVDWSSELEKVKAGTSTFIKASPKDEAAGEPPAPVVVEPSRPVETVTLTPQSHTGAVAKSPIDWRVIAPALLLVFGGVWMWRVRR